MKNSWIHKHEGKEIERLYPIGEQIRTFSVSSRGCTEHDAVIIGYKSYSFYESQPIWYLVVELECGTQCMTSASKTHKNAHYMVLNLKYVKEKPSDK